VTHSNESPERATVGRREFLKVVGAAGLVGALPGAVRAFGQTPATARGAAPAGTTAGAAASADTTARAEAPGGPSEDAIALAGVLRRRFPGRLTDEQWTSVTRGLDGRLGSGKRLREFKLANSVEPDSTFRP
jgi:hypothetical protein